MRGVWAVMLLLSCVGGVGAQTQRGSSANAVTFRDITQKAGIHFVHNNAAFGKKYLPETMGPGVAFIGYDNDGWPDTSS